MKEYNKNNVPLARCLRKNMTPWERKLWYTFLRDFPLRFQRQKPLGNYITDFYCAKAKLVIELDGSGHFDETQMVSDLRRTNDLNSMGIRVLRICNIDIDKNFRAVCDLIESEVNKSLPQSPEATAPSSDGAKGRP